MAYAIKMNMKKSDEKPDNYTDWTVYPLEGIWDIAKNVKYKSDNELNKDNLVFNLMIRQPDFVSEEFFNEMIEFTKKENQTTYSKR